MTLSDMVLELIKEDVRPKVNLGRSELARRVRQKLRKKVKGTLVTWTVNDLLKMVNNRKRLLGSEMGDMRVFRLVKTSPNLNSKQILFHGESKGTKIYKDSISFYKVNYSDVKNKKFPVTVNLPYNRIGYMEQLRSNAHPIQTRCNCKDFFFRWAFWSKKKKALLGKAFPAYKRKTTTWPEVNPAHVPGFCKHIYQLIIRLKKDRILI